MKRLSGLNTVIYDVDGEPMRARTDSPPTTVKLVLATILSHGHDTEDPVKAMMTAFAVRDADDTVDLEDAEFDRLNKAVRADRTYINLVLAEAYKTLDAVKDVAKEVPAAAS